MHSHPNLQPLRLFASSAQWAVLFFVLCCLAPAFSGTVSIQGKPDGREGGRSGRVPLAGTSLGFSGEERIDLGNIPNLDADLTFELWLRPGDRSVRRNPLAKAYSAEGSITQEVNGALTFHHGESGGNAPGYDLLRSSPLQPGAWSHAVVTRYGQTVTWYVNGVQDSQKVFTKNASNSSQPLMIGDGHTNGYDGLIDEVAIYDRALTGEEIIDHFNAIGDAVAYGGKILAGAPLGYWRLDESAGPSATDAVGNHPGLIYGDPSFAEPGAEMPAPPAYRLGTSVGFSGEGQVIVGDLQGLTGDVSIELWLRPGDRSVVRTPLGKAYSGEGNITQEISGELTFHHGEDGGDTPGNDSLRSSPLTPGVWSHVVVTRQGSLVSWYIDGVLDQQKIFAQTPSDSDLPLTIGNGNQQGYDGEIDEVAVYDRELSADEILEHYQAIANDTAYGQLIRDDHPLGYWRLDDGPGQVAHDEMDSFPGSFSGTTFHFRPGASVPRFDSLLLSIDGEFSGQSFESGRLRIDPDPPLNVAQSWISLSLIIADSEEQLACELGGMPLTRVSGEPLRVDFHPAYFFEELPLICKLGSTEILELTIEVVAEDPVLENYASSRYLPRGIDDGSGDVYAGWRSPNYYGSIYRFIEYGEVYSHPEIYGVDPDTDYYKDIEAYLINGAEAFFEPCVDYDIFTSLESRQCRSQDRVGKYYLWRCPNIDVIRTIHSKVELRGAGGVAQAIKAILLRQPETATEICKVSDNPSEIRDSSLACRALNVRRLLFREIWTKWTDTPWMLGAGVNPEDGIEGTPVAHYVAWSELIGDLFRSTAHIPHHRRYGTEPMISVDSRIDFLLGFFDTDADGYTTMRCSNPTQPRNCPWGDYDFANAEGIEIGHQDLTIHLLTQHDEPVACSPSGASCFDMREVARTLSDRTWIGQDHPAYFNPSNFPKFDVFFGGYCKTHVLDEQDPLYGFCQETWVEESSAWRPHRALAGWVNLGIYDRELMIRLRQSVDENNDGVLDASDARLRNFATYLIRALARNGRGSPLSHPWRPPD